MRHEIYIPWRCDQLRPWTKHLTPPGTSARVLKIACVYIRDILPSSSFYGEIFLVSIVSDCGLIPLRNEIFPQI